MDNNPSFTIPQGVLTEEFTKAVRDITIKCLEVDYEITKQTAYVMILELGAKAFNEGATFDLTKAKNVHIKLKSVRITQESNL